MPDSPVELAALLLSTAAAGAVNAVAGGGTLLTFPTLVGMGLDPVVANATSTVGLLPGAAGSVWGYRRELADVGADARRLAPASLIGGGAGAYLLLRTPPPVFERIVPFLILGATILFMAKNRITGPSQPSAPTPRRRIAVFVLQLTIATYGGYFGAGIGILMLATLSLLALGSIHRANALKALSAGLINGVAACLFMIKGTVDWRTAGLMLVASYAGGYFGADRARRLGEPTIRGIVVAIGLISSAALGLRALR